MKEQSCVMLIHTPESYRELHCIVKLASNLSSMHFVYAMEQRGSVHACGRVEGQLCKYGQGKCERNKYYHLH